MSEVSSDRRRVHFKNEPSTLQTHRQHAVCVREAQKRYGRKNNQIIILDGLNMTVPKGNIYGLLGASGCGKTTLLNCILGRKRLNSGEIWVLGGKPGSRGSGVPGPRVGYMPQETALYGEFTIRETLKYFGWISDMTTREVENKLHFLINFLLLPHADEFVKNLSGGQQRRVSFAASLLHDPELLILDEPTVGVDPLLRQSIWDHLIEITRTGRTTVILTTHYIDEARQAHLIGLMRGGYFLAEASPQSMVARFNCDNLEEVFLKLSVAQNRGTARRGSIAKEVTEIQDSSGCTNEAATLDDEAVGESGDNLYATRREKDKSPMVPPYEESPIAATNFNFNHMKVLIWKNFLWMWRNVSFMLFIALLPLFQTIIFGVYIGHEPKHLALAVVNHELETSESCRLTPQCNGTKLSCNYLDYLQKRTFQLTFYSNAEEAKESVRRGEAWATLMFPSNFSEATRFRVSEGGYLEDWDFVASSVEVYQDKSNEIIGSHVERDFYFAFENFLKDHLTSCNFSTKIGPLPIKWEKPVYGNDNPEFIDFMAPGVILTIIFFMAVALTSTAMIEEKTEGIVERSMVNGITSVELLVSLVITQFTVMLVQSIMVVFVSFGIFGITQLGNIVWVTLLVVITGFCGMCYGFMVACGCDTARVAQYISMGSYLPMTNLCGIVWPIEGMHEILRYVSPFFPLTKSTESLRCIMARGWDITIPAVYEGFAVTLIWIVIFITLSILMLKFKRN